MKRICSLLLISLPLSLWAQTWQLRATYQFADSIVAGDVGPLGDLYWGTASGSLHVYTAGGQEKYTFSANTPASFSSIDAGNSLKVFCFYASLNRFEFLDRFTSQPREYFVTDFGLPGAERAAVDLVGNLWFLSRGSLISVDIINRRVGQPIEVPDSFWSATQLHQTRLMILVAPDSGVLVMDEEGVVINQLEQRVSPIVDVQADRITGLSGDKLWHWSIQSGALQEIQAPDVFDFVLQSGQDYHFVRDNQVYVYTRR